ncbi:type IV pilin protein [Pseudomonas fontis]|uniref:Prepilin-type N-terminal cleavage/methylation domain-containing protein n=1 Tax=Pseudomonas fontis TaxID=2942633 RepID=A0ABT5NUP1_9PSED|nr:type IV pilin protein [Pseudomonas fontis]MDD0974249.1 prepilin-type N-terminal cleavage/methylation domain-containing protein [Pseudomonas fontis]MDD0991900.1 prepilin-type N-terminal cleavage/methylation domain-containing protein [Pseudomonas fontis]
MSLIELLIVVAVVGMLASIAYPSYSDQVRKAARTEIAGLLFESAHHLERHYAQAGHYADREGVVTPLSPGTRHYRLQAAREAERFTLTATRRAGSMMAADPCGDFELDQRGVRGNPHAVEDRDLRCWGS